MSPDGQTDKQTDRWTSPQHNTPDGQIIKSATWWLLVELWPLNDINTISIHSRQLCNECAQSITVIPSIVVEWNRQVRIFLGMRYYMTLYGMKAVYSHWWYSIQHLTLLYYPNLKSEHSNKSFRCALRVSQHLLHSCLTAAICAFSLWILCLEQLKLCPEWTQKFPNSPCDWCASVNKVNHTGN